MSCIYCDISSNTYTAQVCCQQRLHDDQERYAMQREALRIARVRGQRDRASEIYRYEREFGESRTEQLKIEVKRYWGLLRAAT
jgi:hypothetical protein